MTQKTAEIKAEILLRPLSNINADIILRERRGVFPILRRHEEKLGFCRTTRGSTVAPLRVRGSTPTCVKLMDGLIKILRGVTSAVVTRFVPKTSPWNSQVE